MTAFVVLAGAMLLGALFLLARPLLAPTLDEAARARREKLAALDAAHRAGVVDGAEYAAKRRALESEGGTGAVQRAPLLPVAVLALLLPFAAIAIYRVVGNPRALDPAAHVRGDAASTDAPALADAVKGLEERLANEPGDVQGWLLLGRAHKTLQDFAKARDALAKARELAPEDPDVLVEFAEASALASADRRLAGAPRALIEKALGAAPDHQRGLWLLGIAQVQDEDYIGAVATWERLLPQLPPDSDVAASVREQIGRARAEAGLPPGPDGAVADAGGAPPTAPAAVAPAASTGADGPALTVVVDVSPELKARIAPSDTLFVFARAPEGPRMPLAIQRLPASALPATVRLDDSMGMLPTLKLSQAAQVVIGARVSKSGNATPQSGDLEVISAPLDPRTQTAIVRLTIASALP